MYERYPARKIAAPLFVLLFSIGWYVFSTTVLGDANQQTFEAGRFGAYVTPQYFQAYLQAVEISMAAVTLMALAALIYSLLGHFKSRYPSPEGRLHG